MEGTDLIGNNELSNSKLSGNAMNPIDPINAINATNEIDDGIKHRFDGINKVLMELMNLVSRMIEDAKIRKPGRYAMGRSMQSECRVGKRGERGSHDRSHACNQVIAQLNPGVVSRI